MYRLRHHKGWSLAKIGRQYNITGKAIDFRLKNYERRLNKNGEKSEVDDEFISKLAEETRRQLLEEQTPLDDKRGLTVVDPNTLRFLDKEK